MFNHIDSKSGARHVSALCLVLIAFGAAFYKVAHRPPPALFQLPVIARNVLAGQTVSAAPGIRTHFGSRQQKISTHAASLVELGDGRIRAFWFAGSREGAQDVEIRTAVYDPAKDSWSPERSIATFLQEGPEAAAEVAPLELSAEVEPATAGGSGDGDAGEVRQVVGMPQMRLRQCPKCGAASLIRQEGCDTCTSCDYSKCG